MTFPTRPSLTARLADQPVARLIAYYLVLAAGVLVLYRLDPNLPGVFSSGRFDTVGGNALSGGGVAPASEIGAIVAAKEAVIAMAGAYLLTLPVAWVYILTRQKRGYQQSLVQTLVILPIVVAGVVILVKGSMALAFGLGGIVGAIAFRNRLEDTKDAVQVFLAIGVGVACGMQVMSVAVALSVFYNLINLTLWWTDFGRVPAAFEGPPARQRLAQLRQSQARRTGAFVSQIDSMLLKSMTPEQLEVLADRAHKRRRRMSDDIGLSATGELKLPKFDGTLRLISQGGDFDQVRQPVEQVLASQAKFWQFEAVTHADQGRQALLYKVRFKKSVPGPLLLEAVRRAVVGKVTSVDLS
jgi:hypothetical protein